MPETLDFEKTVHVSSRGGPRPVGSVVGQFHRTTGMLEMTIDIASGPDARGLLVQLTPVPATSSDGATSE